VAKNSRSLGVLVMAVVLVAATLLTASPVLAGKPVGRGNGGGAKSTSGIATCAQGAAHQAGIDVTVTG